MAHSNTLMTVKHLILLCVVFLVCPSYVFCHKDDQLSVAEHKHVHCSHEHPKADDIVTGVHLGAAHVVRKRSIDQPLRISIFYDHSVYRLEPTKFDLINNTILPEAVKFWEEALKVRKTSGPIRLNRKCPTRQVFIRGGVSHCIDSCRAETLCGEVRVPEHHLNVQATMDPYTRLPLKKIEYETERPKLKDKPLRQGKMYTRNNNKEKAVEMNRNLIRDQNKPKLPRDHEDDIPAKEAYDEYDDKMIQKPERQQVAPLVSQQQKLLKTVEGNKFDKFSDEKTYREKENKENNKFDKFIDEKTQKEEDDNKYNKFDKFIDEKTQKEEDNKKYDTEKSTEQRFKNEFSRENSGHETQKFRRFSTIRRPAYERENRASEAEIGEAIELQNAEETMPPNDMKNYIFARARDDDEETKTSTPTTTRERNEFDQYDNFKTKPINNFYLAQKETNGAPEKETTEDNTIKLSENNENEKLKDSEDITEAAVNLSDENVKFSKQLESIESDSNYDAFNEAKQPILESVLSKRLQGKALATSGALILADPHSETPWWEKDLPCFVCNSTGHNCRALPRDQPAKNEDDPAQHEDQFTPWHDGANSLGEGSELPELPASADPEVVEEPAGVQDSDFVLYVSAVETERCRRGLTVAYASHCQQESALDRPVAGHANFCPGELSTKYRDLPSVMSTVKHEMLHALGFSVSLFAFYRDDDGEPLTERRPDTGNPPLDEELQIHKWSDRVVRNVTRKNWMVRGGLIQRTFNMVVTPRVVREVREHFNCSSLEGAELEDQGGDGTALTHWEKRVFENEAMTGTHTQNSVFSRITFAMMEDTGWYRADYDRAAPLHWGKGLGCVFAQESCKRWINQERLKRHNPAPFCERIKGDPLRTECSPRRDAVVLCNLVRHDTVLPRAYQHFDSIPGVSPKDLAHYGGSVSLADYCPYLQQFTWRHKTVLVRGSRCSYEENTPKMDVNFALENYGAHSKCFDHSDRVWEQKSCRQIREWQHWGSGCYKYKCESGRLHIVVGNYTYMCAHAGQVLMIRIINNGWLHKGGVVCPPCREMCADEFASRGEYCKGGEEALPPNLYPNDILTCGVHSLSPVTALSMAAIFVTSIAHRLMSSLAT